MDLDQYYTHELDYQRSEVMERLKYQHDFSQAGLKNLMIVNGGGIVAILTFIGNKGHQTNPSCIRWAMILFGVALALTLVAYLLSYLSQAQLMDCAAYRMRAAQAKLLGTQYEDKSESHHTNGMRIIKCAIISVVGSLGFFAVGAWLCLNGLT
jgi:ABC-type siderophore export system fused ATPase/permease subunit